MRENAMRDYEEIVGKDDPHVKAAKIILAEKYEKAKFNDLLGSFPDGLVRLVMTHFHKIRSMVPESEKSDVELLSILIEHQTRQGSLCLLLYSRDIKRLIDRELFSFNELIALEPSVSSEIIRHTKEILRIYDGTKESFESLMALDEKDKSYLFKRSQSICKLKMKADVTLAYLLNLAPEIRDILIANHVSVAVIKETQNINLQQLTVLPLTDLKSVLQNPKSWNSVSILIKLKPEISPSNVPRFV